MSAIKHIIQSNVIKISLFMSLLIKRQGPYVEFFLLGVEAEFGIDHSLESCELDKGTNEKSKNMWTF